MIDLTERCASFAAPPINMADHNDTHEKGGGFWGLANILLAIGFGGFALFAGATLIFGGIRNTFGGKAVPAASAAAPSAVAAPTAATPAASAPVAAGDTVAVTIKPGLANPMSYDVTVINAKSGQKVKITFVNQHPTAPLQHNIIVGKPGSKDALIAAANAMMAEMPKWLAKGFIPETPEVLHHTKLVNPGETEVLEFAAGPKGDYPYLCTFPGHSIIMQGVLKVE